MKVKVTKSGLRINHVQKIVDSMGGVHSKKAKTSAPKPPKLRKSITPGTVLIILKGSFRGKRVVFLKQLESGLLLAIGPHELNQVPLIRINQRYVIATVTKINLGQISLEECTDALFLHPSRSKDADFIPKPSMEVDHPHQDKLTHLQRELDQHVLSVVQETPLLDVYLKTLFGLEKGQAPHKLCF